MEEFRVIGEYYWQQEVTEEKEPHVTLPVPEKGICFEVTQLGKQSAYGGPLALH
jgi:hypothetical protein